MIKISLKNIGKLIKKNRIFILLIFSQLIAVNIIYFVYGIYVSYNASKQEMTIDSYELNSHFVDGMEPKMAECRECFEKIFETTQKRLDYFWICGGYESGAMWGVHNEYKDGEYRCSQTVKANTAITDGRFFTEEEVNSGTKVILGTHVGKVGEKYCGYEIVGIDGTFAYSTRELVEVSYKGFPDDAYVDALDLCFEKLPRQTDYIAFKDILEGEFGDRIVVEEFPVKDVEELISINSIMLFVVIIGVTMALDTGLLYGYIISKRRKQMAVFSLTGAEKKQLFIINETEILIVSTITLLTGMTIFKLFFEKIIKRMYEVEATIYSLKIYAELSVVYLLCMLIVTSVITYIYSDSNVMNMIRRRDN